MDQKKKTKIWVIVFLSTLAVAGILATVIGQKTQLFKGFVNIQIPPEVIAAAHCASIQTSQSCNSDPQCNWENTVPFGQPHCIPDTEAAAPAQPNLEIKPDEQLVSEVTAQGKNVITAGTRRVVGSFHFKNASGQTINIRNIKVMIGGPNLPTNQLSVSKMHHFVFVKDLSPDRLDDVSPNLVGLTQSGVIEPYLGNATWFNNNSNLFTIAAGATARVSLVASIDADAPGGKEIRLRIFGGMDIGAEPVPNIMGSFPVNGGYFEILGNAATQPDLKAELLSWPNVNIIAGTPVTFSTFSVKNIGTEAAPPNFTVRFCMDNTECASNITGRLGTSDSIHEAVLAPGASSTMSSAAWTAAAGNHKVVFCVDITNIVLREPLPNDNNCVAHTFDVAAGAVPVGPPVTVAAVPGWSNANTNVAAGSTQFSFGKFQLTGSAVVPNTRIQLKKTGTLPDGKIQSLVLTSSGTTVAQMSLAANGIWQSVNPTISIPANQTVSLELKGTIAPDASVGSDITFSIEAQPSGFINITSGIPFGLQHTTVTATLPVANPNYLPQPQKYEPADEGTITTLTPTLRWRLLPAGQFPTGNKPYHFRWALIEVDTRLAVLSRNFSVSISDILPPGMPASCGTAIGGVTNAWACTELTVPPGVLKYGTRYRWYVHANNGQKYTEWCDADYPTNPYCTANDHVNVYFTTPSPPGLNVSADLPAGQNATIPAITNQIVKLFTLNFTMSGGNPLTDRLKKITLEYAGASPLEISKITDLHLFRGDSTEFTVGATNKDLISLNKNATNGTIEIVFQIAGPTTLLADERNKHLTLYAKINGSQGDNGKKIQFQVKSVEIEPAAGSLMALSIPTPVITVHEDPPDAPVATLQAAPASINQGQSTTLTWTVTGATTMSIDQGVGNIQGTGSRTVNPLTDTTYTLSATNAGGTIARTVAIAVAQPVAPSPPPPPPPPPGSSSAQTCEQQGLYTYTGQPKPGERVTGMCIPCTTEKYIAGAGSCEVKKKKKSGSTIDRAFAPTNENQAAPASASVGASGSQRPAAAAAAPSPNLQGSQRLVRAPERANTGPETLVYIVILSAVHAGLWVRRRMKR